MDERNAAYEAVEVLVFVTRADGCEVLLLHRREADGGFWHGVSGTVDDGESTTAAASRELFEEIGLASDEQWAAHARRTEYAYTRPRSTAPSDLIDVKVECYRVDVAREFVPLLNDEHDGYEWCDPWQAGNLLHWANSARALAKLLSASGSKRPGVDGPRQHARKRLDRPRR